MYTPVSSKVDFPAMEKDILAFWEKENIFRKSLELTLDKPPYVFYDGPPFATGLPHYGHLLAGTIKDIVPRYQTMRGHHVVRRFGWDCHGLPIEALAQDALGVAGAYEIKNFGVDKFNEQCRSMVLRYVSEWRKTVTRMGRWVDFDNDYKTMQPEYMETIWWVFKQLWDQGRVYKSHRIMPYSWKLSTPLSNFEAGSNYKDVQAQTVTVRTKALAAESAEMKGLLSKEPIVYLLIWTTTPWTLPENLAMCAGASIDYVAVRDLTDDARPIYIMAEKRLPHIFKKPEQYEVVLSMKGTALKGTAYEPIFPYYADKRAEGAFRVLNDDYVTTDDGVGIVHIAPAYGEDDFRVCKEGGVNAFVDPLDSSCAFNDEIPEYKGRFCMDCDKDIIRRLKEEGKLVHQATIMHSYPFCDRTDTPLVYRAIEAWYVKIEDIHERLTASNDEVKWMPEYVGDKRFGNWLKEARDWNISRNRFWGSCIPVWVNDDDPEDRICVGSRAELEALSGEKVTDLHKHFLDKIAIRRGGKTYHRTPEVLDCWFESGAMPYAQNHYPFAPQFDGGSNEGEFGKIFPADFIAEGLDQTRGWFYTLLVLGTLLFGRSPYRHVVVNGLVLAEDGKKMSKRLKNYPDPVKVIEECGADALRLYMVYSPVVRAENLRFSENGVKQLMRDILIPLWNAYSFFVTYANVDGWHEDKLVAPSSANELDRWIVSSLETLVSDVTEAMDNYDLQRSVRPFVSFIDNLTNWYIRRSRRRFWRSQNDEDKVQAYRTLRYILVQLSKVAAPFTPFIAESIYRNLRGSDMPESVHLCAFPTANAAARDLGLEKQMALAQIAVNLGHSLRKQNDLKVRQPLARAILVSSDADTIAALRPMSPVISEELNVKDVEFADDESQFVQFSAKANFKTLGKKLGKRMKSAADAITRLPSDELKAVQQGRAITLAMADGEGDVELSPDDVLLSRQEKAGLTVANEGSVTLALETTLSQELILEGIAREFVSKVQASRKESNLEVTQMIRIAFSGDAEAVAALNAHKDYICAETLCSDFSIVDSAAGASVDLNGHAGTFSVDPVK